MRIRSLPCKQQLNVRTCFEAAKRRSTKGLAYADELVDRMYVNANEKSKAI